MLDPVKNFAFVEVSTGYDAAATSIALVTNDGAKLPDPSVDGAFNLVWWNYTDYKNPSEDPNREIVRVTARSTDTLTIVRPVVGNDYNGEGSENTASTKNETDKTYKMILSFTKKPSDDISKSLFKKNLLKNGNFINNSSNGYGATPDDFTNSSANPVQGGIPTLTKAQLISILGVADGDIEGLWNLDEASGNAIDKSSNGYDLTDNNTVGSSLDGLKEKARDFIAANTEYLDLADASCPNLELSGSQSWIAFVKQDILGGWQIGKSNSTPSDYIGISVGTDGKVSFVVQGLTTNTTVTSDIVLGTGKWYMIAGVYDSANSKLKVFVNSIKKEETASGSHTDSNGDFAIGRLGAWNNASSYNDGLIQNAMVLSVALTDDQVKRLFAYTLYKGQKIRRATSDGYIYQDLPQDLVERLRGKEITLRADMYQDVASIGTISIYDGVTETELTADATTDSWFEKSVTKTISADATQIQIRAKVSTSDGNVWFKRLSLYEGSILLPYEHSDDDWSRFPRLLKMDIPYILNGYEFEEGREYSYTPTGPTNTTMTGYYIHKGKQAHGRIYGALTGTPSWASMPSLPFKAGANMPVASDTYQLAGSGGYLDEGTANRPGGLAPKIATDGLVCTLIDTDSAGNRLAVTASTPIVWANTDDWFVQFVSELD